MSVSTRFNAHQETEICVGACVGYFTKWRANASSRVITREILAA